MEPKAKKFTLLLVDDEEHVLTSLSRALHKEPYHIMTALNAREGLNLLNREPVDLILSDYAMPEMSGLDFFRRTRKLYPKMLRIMLTGKAGYMEAIQAINEGLVYRFLTKPWVNDELKLTLRQALEHKVTEEALEQTQDELRVKNQKLTEYLEEIQAAQDLNDIIIRNMRSGLIVMNLEGRVLKVNQTALEIFELREETEIVGRLLIDFNSSLMDFCRVEETSLHREVQFKTKDSESIPLGFSTNFLYGHNRERSGMICIFRDLTELKHSRQALLRSEDNFRKLVDNLSDVVVEIDLNGKFRYLSPRVQEIFGFSPEELLNKSEFEFIHLEDLEVALQKLSNLLATRAVIKLDLRTRHRDGHYIPVSISARIVKDEDGNDYIIAIISDITERRKTEEALAAGEKRLRQITENMLDMVSMVGEGGFIQYASPSHQRILGYRPEDLLGRQIFELVHPDDLERVVNATQTAMNKNGEGGISYRYRHADGHYLWLESVGTEIYDEQDKAVGAVFGSREITQRKLTEESLKESEERFRSIINEVSDIIYVHDFEGKFIIANKTAFEFTGYTPEEMSRVGFSNLLRQKNLEKAINLTMEMMSGTPAPPPYELEIIKKDGSPALLELHVRLYYEKDQPIGILGVGRDITERKKLEEMRRYQELFDNVRDIILVTDFAGQIVEANEAVSRNLGYTHRELKNLNLSDLISSRFSATLQQAMEKVQETGRFNFETVFKSQTGGLIYTDTDARTITFLGRPAILTVSRNITELKKIAQELSRRNRELESILYSASHDLRAPLVTIQGFVELLTEMFGAELPSQANDFLVRIRKASENLSGLLADLVKITRSEHEAVKPEELALPPLINKVWAQLQPLYRDRKVRLILAPDFPRIYADPDRLFQVLENLLANAIRFSQEESESQISIGWHEDPDNIIISIKDNGIGIDPRHHQRIFDPFYRIQDLECEGSGIGLALVKLIVEQHGGRIWVESTKGQGAVFYFSLPKFALPENG